MRKRSKEGGKARLHSHAEGNIRCAEPDARGGHGAWVCRAWSKITSAEAPLAHGKRDQHIEDEPHAILRSVSTVVRACCLVRMFTSREKQADISPILGGDHYPLRNGGLLSSPNRSQSITVRQKASQRFWYVILRIFLSCTFLRFTRCIAQAHLLYDDGRWTMDDG